MIKGKKYVVLTGTLSSKYVTTIDCVNVFGPFTLKEAEKFKRQCDKHTDDLWTPGAMYADGGSLALVPKPAPAVVVKVNGPYSWPAKVVTRSPLRW